MKNVLAVLAVRRRFSGLYPLLPHRYHLHFTPTSASWLNQVERWFAEITRKRIRRGTFRSVTSLVKAINDYVRENNATAQPFIWTATAATITRKIRKYKRISETGHYWLMASRFALPVILSRQKLESNGKRHRSNGQIRLLNRRTLIRPCLSRDRLSAPTAPIMATE